MGLNTNWESPNKGRWTEKKKKKESKVLMCRVSKLDLGLDLYRLVSQLYVLGQITSNTCTSALSSVKGGEFLSNGR